MYCLRPAWNPILLKRSTLNPFLIWKTTFEVSNCSNKYILNNTSYTDFNMPSLETISRQMSGTEILCKQRGICQKEVNGVLSK